MTKTTRYGATVLLVVGVLAGSTLAYAQEENPIFTVSLADNIEIYGLRTIGGSSYFPLKPNNAGYVVVLPLGYGLTSLEGSAELAGQQATSTAGGTSAGAAAGGVASAQEGAASASDVSSAGSGAPLATEGPTDWIELSTSVATLYYFSPDGTADEGPTWRQESPSIWIRRLPNSDVVLWVGQPGTSPPAL